MTIETILAYVGIALAVIGLIASYYFYKLSIRKKEPIYSIKSNNLVSGSTSTLENLTIAYKKRKVENLTVSKILFYNRGAETINKQELETINRLRISSETCRVLDASLLQANNISNNVSVSYDKDGNNVFVDFDYLDKNQGAVVQVIHTGLSSKNIGLYGDIKGVQNLRQVDPKQLLISSPLTKTGRRIVWITVSVASLGLYFINFQNDVFSSLRDSGNLFLWLVALLIASGTIVSTGFLIMLAVDFLNRFFRPSRVIPKGLENFDE